MRIFFITLFIWFLSCGSPKHNTQDAPAYSAAVEARFVDDQNLKKELSLFNKKIIAAKYIESLAVGRATVTISEIDNYYNSNKTEFKRSDDEVVVLMFKGLDKNTAIKIKNTLDRNPLDNDKSSGVITQHKPVRVVFKKDEVRENLANRLFNTRKGGSFIIQQNSGFTVFYVLGVFIRGTVKDLVFVSDEIQAKLLAIKKHQLKEKIIDSLETEYAKP